MPEQNHDASELHKAEVVLLVPFVTDENASEVVQPGEEPFDLPASVVSAEHPAILGLGSGAVLPMRSDHLDIVFLLQRVIQRIAIVGSVADQPLRHLPDEPSVQSLFFQRDFMRRSTGCAYGERKTRAVCDCHDLGPFASLGLANA